MSEDSAQDATTPTASNPVRSFPVIVIALFLAAASGLRGGVPVRPNGPAAPSKLYGLGTAPFAQAPSASCASASCHGGGSVGRRGSEHTTWAPEVFADGPHDPHAKAYRVLFNATSARMAKYLGPEPAHKQALCLKCHAVDGVRPAPAVSGGVGCGACHGPAEKWLTAHVQPGWKGLTNQKKWDDYGFVPAGNLVARTMNCVGCHVGDADRDVNHDLLALGHPRLNFEYTRWHFNPQYRRHWDEKMPQPDFEVRAWVAGQAATLRAATELLRGRAERAAADAPGAVWPEFAGLNCYACHQKVGTGVAKGTIPGWEAWSNAAVGVAAEHCSATFPAVASPELRELAALRTLLEKANPNPRAVAVQAGKAVTELDAWLAELQATEDRGGWRVPADAPRRIANALAHNGTAAHDRDALAANYLGVAAMYHAAGGKAAFPAWTDPLRELTTALKFGAFERERVRKSFEALHAATTPGGKR